MTEPIRLHRTTWGPEATQAGPVVLRATVAPADVSHLRSEVGRVRHAVEAPVQVVRADRVLSRIHVLMAATHARRAHAAGRGRADDPSVEWLVYAAVDRQIRHAVAALGVPMGEPTRALVVILDAADPDVAVDAAVQVGWTEVGPWDDARHKADVVWWDQKLDADRSLDAEERQTRLLAAMAQLALDRP